MQFIVTLLLLLSIEATAQTTKTLSNRALDQDLKICVNDGGVEKCPVEIDGATGKFKGVDGLADASSPGMVDHYSEDNSGNPVITGEAGVSSISSGFLVYTRIGNVIFCELSYTGTFVAGLQRISFPATALPFTIATTHQLYGSSIRVQSAANLSDQGHVRAIGNTIYAVHPAGLSGTAKSNFLEFRYRTND